MTIEPAANEQLLSEIARAFQFIEMPSYSNLTFHKTDCILFDVERDSLEKIRSAGVHQENFRQHHVEMGCVSAETMLWVLPYYINHCIKYEAADDPLLSERLIYNFGPSNEHKAELSEQLSLLNKQQIICLIHFVDWCSKHYKLKDNLPEDIAKANSYLDSLLS